MLNGSVVVKSWSLANPLTLHRDARTVFAHNLPIRATESELMEFFGQVGKVRDVSLP